MFYLSIEFILLLIYWSGTIFRGEEIIVILFLTLVPSKFSFTERNKLFWKVNSNRLPPFCKKVV